MQHRIAKIAVENAAYAFDKLYCYLLPPELSFLQPGCRVNVPFGGGNRVRTGIIVEIEEDGNREGIKPVSSAIDSEPVLSSEGLILLRYLKESTFCTWFDALRLLIPAGLGIKRAVVYSPGDPSLLSNPTPLQSDILALVASGKKTVTQETLCKKLGIDCKNTQLASLVQSGAIRCVEKTTQRIQDDKICMVRLLDPQVPAPATPKQQLVLNFLEDAQTASLKEICYYTGVTRAVVDGLQRKKRVAYYDAVQLRSPFMQQQTEIETNDCLTAEQQAAFEQLATLTEGKKPASALLYGVTGSGKTHVFLHLVDDVTAKGRTALVLVPEISLTAQAVESFRRRFGNKVALLHSALSLGERIDEWKRIRSGDATIVIGTRSAVFAPLRNIGLIVIDEEQEHTYQSEKSPRYCAREVALRRCAIHGALLLLASATPSIESFYHAKQGHYHLVELTERYSGAMLPDVYMVNMGDAQNASESPAFSRRLLDELYYNLEHGEQSILLLNRRGYSTVIKCSACAAVAECPNCSVAMTYHAANDSLLCHYCGYLRKKPESCDQCGNDLLRYAGFGTQKLEEELLRFFPKARVLRIDMDTTMSKFSHEKLFNAFLAHDYDIMIGTQMVAKGLNFPNVTLVGVLSADQALYAGDFRSYERSFSLLTQVVGRCGRGDKRGRAFIQTYSPDHPVITLAAQQDYLSFYTQEIQSRKLHLYPPFCTIAGIGFVGAELSQVQHWANAFLSQFSKTASANYPGLPIRALGPVPSDIVKAAGKYRYKLLLKCKNNPQTRALLEEMLLWFYKECKTVSVFIDMHYDRI